MLTSMYLRESKGKKLVGGVGRTKPYISTAGCNSENSEVHVRYARGRRGTALSCLTGCDRSLFLFGLLASYPSVIVQGIQRKKVGGGHAGAHKVRLPPSSRIVPSGLRN